MSPEFKTVVFKNPNSSRGQSAANRVKRLLHGWLTHDIESRSPRLQDNVYDLADHLKEGTNLIVVGGDGQLRTAAEATKLAGVKDVVIVPVPGGNSCDGSRTFHDKKNILRGNRLINLLKNGMPVPVNTLDITVNGQSYGTAVNYAGIGLTAYSGEAVNSDFVRNVRAKTPGSEHLNGFMRFVEAGAIGATILKHRKENILYERAGAQVASKELLYAAGHSLAGTFTLDGDALERVEPQVVRYEIGAEDFFKHLPGIVRGLMNGDLESERIPQDTVFFSERDAYIPIQIDGEHDYLEPGSILTATVHAQSFQTLRPAS